MKKYTYYLTEKEALEFCMRAVWEQYRRRWGVLVLWGFLCVMETWFYPPAGLFILLLFLLLVGFEVFRSYSGVKSGSLLKERTIWLEDGKIKCSTGSFGEMDCAGFGVIRKSRRLLMLGYLQSKKRVAWHVIPMRAFEDRQEAEAFLEEFGRQAAQGAGRAAGDAARRVPGRELSEQEQEGALFHFSFRMDEAMWIHIYRAATETTSAGTLGPRVRNRKRIWFLLGAIGVILAFSRMVLDVEVSCLILIVLMVAIFLAYTVKSDPAAMIRGRIRTGVIQNDVYGTWDIQITEEGVLQDLRGRQRTFMPWEAFGWLVETEKCFFLFVKENKQFIPMPKCSMKDAQQAAELMELCANKGLAVAQGKRMKYWPAWVFGLLLAGLVLAFLGYTVGRAFWEYRTAAKEWDSAGWAAEYSGEYGMEEEFDPADYPDYVPLDQQAEILRSLGFTVPKETVESVRGWMEEYGMEAYVEGYPFTYLLTELGMPAYNEDWEVVHYPEEVFWFDFEGWDLGQDYVTVLLGMQHLAEGSVLDQAANLRTDLSGVDWDAQTGTVQVMLDFGGREYSWNMEVMYDWIDWNVLGIFNSLLTETEEEKRFYATGDDGQGALVFFADAEWAEEFEKATGLELDFCVTEQKKGKEAVIM